MARILLLDTFLPVTILFTNNTKHNTYNSIHTYYGQTKIRIYLARRLRARS